MGNSKSSKKLDTSNTPAAEKRTKKEIVAPATSREPDKQPEVENTIIEESVETNGEDDVCKIEPKKQDFFQTSEKNDADQDASHAAAKVAATKMSIDLYYLAPSPPCRSVLLVGKVLGIDFNLKVCNVLEGEHLTEDFIKINPQHTIPTINDNGFILWESRPIMSYLVNQYGKDDSLYPKDAKERAIVDQRLYFDIGTLYQRMGDYYFPVIFAGASFDEDKLKKLEEALNFLNIMLEGRKFIATDSLTIADISLVVTISNIDAFGLSLDSYPNIMTWYANIKNVLKPHGYEEINQTGANMLAEFLKSKLG